MSVLCPRCHRPIDVQNRTCASGHTFDLENGVLVLMDESMRHHVQAIYRHREGVQRELPTITDYNRLPCSLAKQHFEWRLRCQDVGIVSRLLNQDEGSILEIGAWNGWLTHHLVRTGYDVTAIDYTTHPDDGLGAKRHYDADWLAIQMDLTDLSVFDPCFDAVIINHGLHLFPDPVTTVKQAQHLLKPGGLLILLNLTFFRNPSQRIAQHQALAETFQKRYGVPFLLRPSRGFMDSGDKAKLKAMGIKFYRYAQRWKANLKSFWVQSAPSYFYGVWGRA